MLAFAGNLLIAGIMVASAAAMPSPASVDVINAAVYSNQESIAQLSVAVLNMTKGDAELKRQLTDTTNILIESQNALQKLLRGARQSDTTSPEGGISKASAGDGMTQFVNDVVSALREVRPQIAGNNTQLASIVAELKSLNAIFKEHLSTLSCPPPFIQLGSECFAVNLEDLPWEEARANCLRMGADLAQPSDLNQLKVYLGQRYPRKSQRNFWIGGVNREKVWQWLSGDLIGNTMWHTNEPSGNGVCLGMFDGWEFPLTDFPCENARRSVCERPISK